MAEFPRFWITTAPLNLRNGPGTQHRSFGVMPKGTLVCSMGEQTLAEDLPWLSVLPLEGNLKGQQGWSCMKWLQGCSLSSSEILGIDAAYSSLDILSILKESLSRFNAAPEVLVQCLWDGGHVPTAAVQNIRQALDLGMVAAIYLNPYRIVRHGESRLRVPAVETVMQAARSALGDLWEKIAFVAVDVERLLDPPSPQGVDPISLTLEAAIDMMRRIRDLGKRPILYTARWFWVGYLRDPRPAELDGALVWLAQYDGKPSLHALRSDFGPRWVVFGKQFLGSTLLKGGTVDFNVFQVDFLTQPEDTNGS